MALRARVPAAPDVAVADVAVSERRVGADRVDLAAALRDLCAHEGARIVRVESGGGLTRGLLHLGLVDELSLLVHPCLAGTRISLRWYGPAPAPPLAVQRLDVQSLDHGLVWLRYRVGAG